MFLVWFRFDLCLRARGNLSSVSGWEEALLWSADGKMPLFLLVTAALISFISVQVQKKALVDSNNLRKGVDCRYSTCTAAAVTTVSKGAEAGSSQPVITSVLQASFPESGSWSQLCSSQCACYPLTR